MSEPANPSLGLLTTGCGAAQTAQAFALACNRVYKGVKVYLFTDHKFDAQKRIKMRNVAAEHPAVLLQLAEAARLAKAAGAGGEEEGGELYFDNGFALYCLSQALEKEPCDGLVLLRRDVDVISAAQDRLARGAQTPFIALDAGPGGNLLFDTRRPETAGLIALALELFLSGAVLSLQDTALDHVLEICVQSMTV